MPGGLEVRALLLLVLQESKFLPLEQMGTGLSQRKLEETVCAAKNGFVTAFSYKYRQGFRSQNFSNKRPRRKSNKFQSDAFVHKVCKGNWLQRIVLNSRMLIVCYSFECWSRFSGLSTLSN